MAHRIERINSMIRQELSELLQRQVKDPRLGTFVAVTEVSTTPDLRYAKVFVSSMDEENNKEEVLKALRSAAGFFRTKLAKSMKMRYTPELTFQWDNSIEQGDRLLKMIDEIYQEE